MQFMEIIKRFMKWIELKQKLHESNHRPPYFKEREIWWCSMGENVGNEMNGKSNYFRRPVIIIRKLDKYSFLCVPLTSKIKEGTWYIQIIHGEKNNTAVISQIKHFDYRRLDKRLATLDYKDFNNVIVGCVNFIRKI